MLPIEFLNRIVCSKMAEAKMLARYCREGESSDVIDTYLQRVKLDLSKTYQESFSEERGQPPVWKRTTYLMSAIRNGKYHTVEALLRHKADPRQEVEGDTPLLVALDKGRYDIVALLRKYGVQVQLGPQDLRRAVQNGRYGTIKDLINQGLQPTEDLLTVLCRSHAGRRRPAENLVELVAVPGTDNQEAMKIALDEHWFLLCNWLLENQLVTPSSELVKHAVETNNVRAVDYCVSKGCPADGIETKNPEILKVLRRRTPRQEGAPRRVMLEKTA